MQAAYAHFGFRANPFAITPDPRFLYLSPLHKDGLAHLMYGMREGGGFVQLTGEVGTGKTTLYRSVLEDLADDVDVALILNPRQSALELLASVCDELQIARDPGSTSIKDLVDRLNAYLLEAHAGGRRVVLIIDEAQDLAPAVLEQIRLLTNLETAERKLLLVVLVGQPELRDLLGRPELRQLAQRVTARYHLMPLSLTETGEYIEHRQRLAEGPGDLFSAAAVRVIYRLSGGVPRLINVICDRTLIAAYADGARGIDARTARRAGREVMDGNRASRPTRRPVLALGMLLTLVVSLAAIGAWALLTPQVEPVAEPRPASVPAGGEAGAGTAIEPPPSAEPAGGTAASVPARPALGELLLEGALSTDTGSAMQRLFALWGRDYATLPGAVACDRARAAGLDCLTGRDGLQTLRGIDRAAVLELEDLQGRRHHLVLSGLDDDMAELQAGARTLLVPLAELAASWSGVYLVLTRPSPVQLVLRAGDEGDAVRWLRRRLALSRGDAPPLDPSAYFDRGLAREVEDFQRKQGLAADGVVGEQTLQKLTALAAVAVEPLLDPDAGQGR